jgi:hypothetical protein
MPPLQQGRVIWAEIADPNGHTKLRPALALTRTDEIQPGESMQVVAITSRLDRPLPRITCFCPGRRAARRAAA